MTSANRLMADIYEFIASLENKPSDWEPSWDVSDYVIPEDGANLGSMHLSAGLADHFVRFQGNLVESIWTRLNFGTPSEQGDLAWLHLIWENYFENSNYQLCMVRVMPVRTVFRSLKEPLANQVDNIRDKPVITVHELGLESIVNINYSFSQSLRIELVGIPFVFPGGDLMRWVLASIVTRRRANNLQDPSQHQPNDFMQLQTSIGIVDPKDIQYSFNGIFPIQNAQAVTDRKQEKILYISHKTLVLTRTNGELVDQLLISFDQNSCVTGILCTSSNVIQLSQVPGVPEALGRLMKNRHC